jgi:enediyne polyketide synthase
MTADSIAIVGIACRYPDANSPNELWQNVLSRRRAFRRIPTCRLSTGYLGSPNDHDRAYVTHAAVLRDWEFDREAFGVPGPLYRSVDHTHWLALETAAEALADAGHPRGEGLDRGNVGVVFGNTLAGEFVRAASLRLRWPYIADAAAQSLQEAGVAPEAASKVLTRMEHLVKRPFPQPGDETLAGALANTIAGRICNHFDFHGTGFTVDGACSSSLVAVTTACRALAAGELDFALAGGVDLSLDPFELVGFSRLGALGTNEMRVYDSRPTGFLPGEGCGVVALARGIDAQRLGMRIYGRIVGWGCSSDGSGGLTRPTVAGQTLAMRRACRMATVPPAALALIEGHGTGTAVGDQIELRALTEVRAGSGEPAALGTVKANIGHTKAAAGMAGLIKATLATHHRVLPPTTGCVDPHPLLTDDAPVRVLSEPEPWCEPTPRAGISSMGFGGINVHVVVEGATSSPRVALNDNIRRLSADRGRYEVVLVDEESPELLSDRLTSVAVAARALSYAELRDVAATEWRRVSLSPRRFRAALLATCPDELATTAAMAASSARLWDERRRVDRRHGYALGTCEPARIGLLFPGQAAPTRHPLSWWARGLDVPELDADIALQAEGGSTAHAQPVIVRQSLAGIQWLRALGVNAVGAVGHSLGEISALSWAEALSPRHALDLAAQRGRIMAIYGDSDCAMASLAVDAETASTLLSGTEAVISGYNAPSITTVSGPAADVETVRTRATQMGVHAVRLNVSHGFHGPTMADAAGPFRELLAGLPIDSPKSPVISTITGHEVRSSGQQLRGLLVQQLTAPVQFRMAVSELARRCDLLVEVGPGTVLTDLAEANSLAVPVVSIDCGGDDRNHALATAALAAGSTDLESYFAERCLRPCSLSDEPRFLINPCEDRTGWAVAGELQPSVADVEDVEAPDESFAAEPNTYEALVAHLSTSLELPTESMNLSSTFLTDLHLSSLQAVEAVATVSARLGKQPPEVPYSLTEATIGQVAELLADAPSMDSCPAPERGVRDWVRTFESHWTPFAFTAPAPLAWLVHAPVGHWLHKYAATEADAVAGLAAVVTREDPTDVVALLRKISDLAPERLLLIHNGHGAAAGVGRSVAMELTHCSVTVVEVRDLDEELDPSLLSLDAAEMYTELRTTSNGRLDKITIAPRRLGSGAKQYLSPGDICLVTGGVQGIAAHAARALGRQTGARLVFLGRTPAWDAGVEAAIMELNSDVAARYICCDVADEDSVEQLVSELRRDGSIGGLLHGAGVNEPRRLADIDSATLTRTLRPKVGGIKTLLKCLGSSLSIVIGFGSIIGRQGLAGQAEYCIANDWLRVELEQWAKSNPGCRTQHIEWSVWSAIGMGARMNVIENLRQRGVEPIDPDAGVTAMLDVLADPHAPVTVAVSSRFPASPTINMTTHAAESWFRFLERPKVDVPGVEVVAEADLSLGSDPYLADHRVDGIALLPGIFGMEAMAQAAAYLNGAAQTWCLTDVEFRSPIRVDDRDGLTMRIAALETDGGVDVVLRDDSDQFSTERFIAHVTRDPGPTRWVQPAEAPGDSKGTTGHAHPFYDNLLFHGRRFHRLLDYDTLSAFRVNAWIHTDGQAAWFSEFYGQQLVFGDPGTHDATLHTLLACLPHRRAIPVGVKRMSLWHKPDGQLQVLARETAHTTDSYTFDVELAKPDGTVVAEWLGLELHGLGPVLWPNGIPRRLIGPWISRRLIERGLADDVEILINDDNHVCRVAAANAARLAGRRTCFGVSADNHVVAFAARPVAVECVSVDDVVLPFLDDSLDTSDRLTADTMAVDSGEPVACTTARVWAARTAAAKLDAAHGGRLRVAAATEDSFVVFSDDRTMLVTCAVHVAESDSPLVIAIATAR